MNKNQARKNRIAYKNLNTVAVYQDAEKAANIAKAEAAVKKYESLGMIKMAARARIVLEAAKEAK